MLTILVTGAAGLVGGEVCARLVARGHRVLALVRNTREVRGNDGQLVPVAGVLEGDVALPGLGIAEGALGAAVPPPDLVVHCAAITRFDASEADYERVNVGGTREVVAFCEAHGAALLHVGTAYVCGPRDGPIGEGDALPASFANGYEASKAEGEKVIRASGLSWAIARPSIVTGDSTSGAIRKFDTTYALFRLISEGFVRHLPATPDATLDFVPIDHVAGGIVALAEAMEQAAGGTFHLVSGDPLPVADFAEVIASCEGFHAPELVEPDGFDPDALPPRERRLYRRVAALYASYFQRNPRFDDANFRALNGMAGPATGPAYLRRLIEYCRETGFLSARPDSAAPAAPARRRPT